MDPGSDNLKTGFSAGQMYELAGQLINARHRRLNAIEAEQQAGHMAGKSFGHVSGKTRHAPTILEVSKVTDASETCAESDDVGESVDAPCAAQNRYIKRSRYYDSVNTRWQEYEEDVDLDAGAYFSSDPNDAVATPVSELANRQVPSFALGDTVATVWDQLRNKAIPLQDPYQDLSQVEFRANAQSVPQAPAWATGPFDDWAAVFLEVRRPQDQDWRVMSSLNWPTPHCEATREWRDSRKNFAVFNAPHGTLVRLRAVSSSTTDVGILRAQMRLWGAGRDNMLADFTPHEAPDTAGGRVLTNWQLRADTVGRFKDSPEFVVDQSGVYEVQYEDPLDAWQIGCWFWAQLETVETLPQLPISIDVVTDIDCDSYGQIIEYCIRTLTFPAEIANCMVIGPEVCFDCDKSTSSLSSVSSSSTSSISSSSTSSLSSSSSSKSSSSSLSSSTRSDCCGQTGDCVWTWNIPNPGWNLTDTCTAVCEPELTCKCINGPTEDGDFDGQQVVGDCVPA